MSQKTISPGKYRCLRALAPLTGFGDNPYGQNYATGGGVGGGFMAGSQGDSPSGRGVSDGKITKCWIDEELTESVPAHLQTSPRSRPQPSRLSDH